MVPEFVLEGLTQRETEKRERGEKSSKRPGAFFFPVRGELGIVMDFVPSNWRTSGGCW